MKTIRVGNRGGFEIITGFDTLRTDPVQSQKNVKAATENHPAKLNHQKALEAVGKKTLELRKWRHTSSKNAGVNIDRTIAELGPLALESERAGQVYAALLVNIAEESAASFQPRRNERILPAEELEPLVELFSGLKRGEVLTVEGAVLMDNIGREYHKKKSGKWAAAKIEALTETLPAGATWADELTPEQRVEIAVQANTDRIAALPAEDKEAEKTAALAGAAAQCAHGKEVAVIQGATAAAALADAKTLYAEMAARIEAQYV